MKYLFTKSKCGACIDLKRGYDLEGVKYKERSADRILEPVDEIDHEAFLKVVRDGGNINDITLPIEVTVEDS